MPVVPSDIGPTSPAARSHNVGRFGELRMGFLRHPRAHDRMSSMSGPRRGAAVIIGAPPADRRCSGRFDSDENPGLPKVRDSLVSHTHYTIANISPWTGVLDESVGPLTNDAAGPAQGRNSAKAVPAWRIAAWRKPSQSGPESAGQGESRTFGRPGSSHRSAGRPTTADPCRSAGLGDHASGPSLGVPGRRLTGLSSASGRCELADLGRTGVARPAASGN